MQFAKTGIRPGPTKPPSITVNRREAYIEIQTLVSVQGCPVSTLRCYTIFEKTKEGG